MLSTENKKEIIQKFGKTQNDTGASEVQIAILSERISYLTDHLRKNKKDFSTRLGLLKLVGRRKSLLKHLKSTSYERYANISKEFGIKIK